MSFNRQFFAYFLTILAGISIGFLPLLSALMTSAGFFTLEQQMLRLLFGCIFGIIVIISYNVKNLNSMMIRNTIINRKLQRNYILQGIILNFQIYTYFSAIVLGTPIGEVALLAQIHPIVTLLIGWLILHEIITREKVIAVFIALIGIIILAQPWTWNNIFSYWLGDILAIMNGTLYGLYLIVGRKNAPMRSNIPFLVSISYVLIWTFIAGAIMTLLFDFLPLPDALHLFRLEKAFSMEGLWFGIILSLVGSFIPYGLIMFTSKFVESSRASILLLGEAITAIILGFFILHQNITFNYVLGGFLLILAIVIILEPFKTSSKKSPQII